MITPALVDCHGLDVDDVDDLPCKGNDFPARHVTFLLGTTISVDSPSVTYIHVSRNVFPEICAFCGFSE